MQLPIDVVPGTHPQHFRWKQTVDTLVGRAVQTNEGPLPPSVEVPVAALIALAKQQAQEIAGLQKINQGLADRVAGQSEVLSGHAERSPPQVSSSKKTKGSV